MSPQDFLANFHEIANAPGGVARLREVVLQLAVTWHLVGKDESEGTADHLCRRIHDARVAFVKSEATKLATYTASAAPPELEAVPSHWLWCKLGDLTTKIGSGSTPRGGSKVYAPKGIPFLRSQNVWNEDLRMDDVVYIPDDVHASMKGTHVQPNDILLNITGASLGRCALVPENLGPANVSQHVTIIRCSLPAIRQFVRLCLLSPFGQAMIWGRQVGMAREGLSKKVLEQFEIPLPPLAEQKRIVAKVEELMALCDALEAQQQERDRLFPHLSRATHTRLTGSPSQPHLNALFTDLGSVSPEDMRRTIQILAIQGKLLSQNPNQESASNDLTRIGISIPQQTSTGSSDLLPSNWLRLKFEDVADVNGGVTLGRNLGQQKTVELPYLRVANVKRGSFDLSVIKTIGVPETEIERYALRKDDLLMTEGGDWDKVGRAAIWKDQVPNCLHQNHVFRSRFKSEEVRPEWFELFFNSPVGRAYFESCAKQTTNLASINMRQVKNCPIPFPPLAEQRRIVAKVDELMGLVDQLEAQQQEQHKLAEAFAQASVAAFTTA